MWEDSIYRFRIPCGVDEKGNPLGKEVVFDVTYAAPPDNYPSEAIVKDVFTPLFALLEKKENLAILDVGAGKLRYTLYFLSMGYTVCAVEYERFKKRSEKFRDNLEEAKKYGERFIGLTYPKEFIDSANNFYDLAILINVINTIPVPYERLLLLDQCHRKLKSNGYLLCCTWYCVKHFLDGFTEENRIGDGYYRGIRKYSKSFAREYEGHEELDEIMSATGFDFRISLPVSRERARVYQKKSGKAYNFFSKVLSRSRLRKSIPVYKSIKDPTSNTPEVVPLNERNKKRVPDPEELSMESLYIELLPKLATGRNDALAYQRLIFLILNRLFRPNLTNFKIEQPISTGRIDISARNLSESGFWGWLSNQHEIHCPWVMFECKNSKNDPENPDFNQIASRLKPRRGRFGMLIYRKTINLEKILEKCKEYVDEDKYIMPIEDDDLIKLLDLKMKRLEKEQEQEEISNYLSDKFEKIFF